MEPENSQNNSLTNFLKKENRRLIGYINKYLDDRLADVDAEDIIQDIALNIYSKTDISVQIRNVAAYIYQAARNKIIDLYRKKNYTVSMEVFNDPQENNLLLNAVKVEEEEELPVYLDEAIQHKLQRAMENLNPHERELIQKTEYEGYTFQELADEWDIPIGTLLARKHRALGKLRKMLQDDFIMFNHKNNSI